MTGNELINVIRMFNLGNKEIEPLNYTKLNEDISSASFPTQSQIDEQKKEKSADELFAKRLGTLHEMYKNGKIKLSDDERDLLEFCARTDMRKFLKEEFEKHPTPDFD